IDLTLLPIVRMLGDNVVHPSEDRRLDVVEAADLIPATTRQPLVAWHGDAERVVVGNGRCLVVGDEEIAVPGAEVAGVERDVPPALVLHPHGGLPVIVLAVVAAQRIGQATRAAGADLPERQIGPSTAFA